LLRGSSPTRWVAPKAHQARPARANGQSVSVPDHCASLGFFTNGVFALFTVWLPELFAGASRGSGLGFTFSLGRILAAAGPLMIGAIAAHTGSYPIAISLISAIYIPGILFAALGRETAGKTLPA